MKANITSVNETCEAILKEIEYHLNGKYDLNYNYIYVGDNKVFTMINYPCSTPRKKISYFLNKDNTINRIYIWNWVRSLIDFNK